MRPQVRPEQDRGADLDRVRTHDVDAYEVADGAPPAVGADDVLGPDDGSLAGRAVHDGRVDPGRALDESRDLRPEPQLGEAMGADAAEEHGLDVILGADGRSGRADRRGLPGIGNPSGTTCRSAAASGTDTDISGSASRLNARISSSTPSRRKISIVRRLTPEARGWTDVPGWRSTSVDRTPCRASTRAVTRPAGPAPTIRTGVLVRRDMTLDSLPWPTPAPLGALISSDRVYSVAQSVR
jgi:hypothetical protein